MQQQRAIYLVNETKIEAEQDASIATSDELRDHVAVINSALDLLSRLPAARTHENEDELIIFRLMVRCFNSAASCLRLLRCGYYQPAFTMVRDVVETTFLLDLFKRDRTEIAEWRSLPAKDRERRFKPFQVRKRLDQLDGFREQKRAVAYKLLSNYAAHPTPEGFAVISPAWMTQVGPFPDEKRLTAGLQELAKHLTYAALVISGNAANTNVKVLAAKETFFAACERWHAKYMPKMTGAENRPTGSAPQRPPRSSS
jgi:hypothetical protein